MPSNKRPPLEVDDLTQNLKQSSGKGIDAFFPAASEPHTRHDTEDEKPGDSPTLPKKTNEKKQEFETQSSSQDVTTSMRHDVNYRKWKEIIEDTESHNSSLRITNEEKYAVKDLVDELERKYKVKTSLNELARLGLLCIVDDFKKEKLNSLVMKVKKS